MRSFWYGLSATLVLAALQSCGDTSEFTSLDPQLSQSPSGSFSLAEPVDSVAAAAQLQLTITSPEPLPETFVIGDATFVPLPLQVAPDAQVYVADVASALVPVEAFDQIQLDSLTQAQIAVTVDSKQSALIYQGDPTEVTLEDFVLVLALSNLPPNLRTPENIITQASTLFSLGSFSVEALDPIPTDFNTDFAAGGSFPAPDLIDATVVYAATFLPAGLRTAENLALTVNTLLPGADLTAADILAIPGDTLPGGLLIQPPVGPAPAGTVQISVQDPTFEAPSFTIGAAEFVRLPNEVFTGFTSYVAQPDSTLVQIEFNQLVIPGANESTCVIVHEPGQDPLTIATQFATSAACPFSTRAVHASPDAPTVDVFANDIEAFPDITFFTVTPFVPFPSGDVTVEVFVDDQLDTPVIDATIPSIPAGTSQTIVVTGLVAPVDNQQPLQIIAFEDDVIPTDGVAEVRILHLSPDAPAVDIRVGNNDPSGALLLGGLEFGNATPANLEVAPGTIEVSVFAAGTDIFAGSAELTLEANRNYTVYATGLLGDGTFALEATIDN